MARSERRWADLLVTTTPGVPGREVVETLGLVAVETLHGISALSDVGTAVRDVIGGRASAASTAVSKAREECVDAVRRDAAKLGADAVVGLRISISAATASVFIIAVQGTAVRLRDDGAEADDDA